MEEQDMKWRKSTFSGGANGSCVEVGNARDVIAVRDTTDRGGFTLTVPGSAFAGLVAGIKAGTVAP